jgi:polyribonucleotide nucleotidyltransferase
MADEPHDAVKLLLARMESHPEEFRLKDPSYHDRWYNHMSAINSYGNEADIAALDAKVRDIRMAEVHEQIMEELLNGDERRAQEEKENEYERHLAAALQHTQQQAMQQNIQNAILRIDSIGNVGVGNVTPSTQLGGVISINRGE